MAIVRVITPKMAALERCTKESEKALNAFSGDATRMSGNANPV